MGDSVETLKHFPKNKFSQLAMVPCTRTDTDSGEPGCPYGKVCREGNDLESHDIAERLATLESNDYECDRCNNTGYVPDINNRDPYTNGRMFNTDVKAGRKKRAYEGLRFLEHNDALGNVSAGDLSMIESLGEDSKAEEKDDGGQNSFIGDDHDDKSQLDGSKNSLDVDSRRRLATTTELTPSERALRCRRLANRPKTHMR